VASRLADLPSHHIAQVIRALRDEPARKRTVRVGDGLTFQDVRETRVNREVKPLTRASILGLWRVRDEAARMDSIPVALRRQHDTIGDQELARPASERRMRLARSLIGADQAKAISCPRVTRTCPVNR
jgi:hypothetical protein